MRKGVQIMRRISGLLSVCVLLGLAVSPSGAATVEEVIAKHIEAKGGRAAWAAIESIEMSGPFTAFSKVEPFVLQRKPGNRYHFDTVQNGHKYEVGYDGERLWTDDHMRQPGATAVKEGPDMAALMRDVEFATPFFDYQERGFTVKLIGETEIEGFPAIGIELTRPDETVDSWYLDPESYLELARASPGSDFGRAMPTLTFFDDFRELSGVMLPHYVESQWYTRSRILVAEKVTINSEIDDAIFAMPAKPGMGPLLDVAGDFKVAVAQRSQPGAPWQESERTGKVVSLVGGAILREEFASDAGDSGICNLSYDQFRETYRYTQIVDSQNFLDVLEGNFNDEGVLVLSNVETGTTWSGFGMTFNARVSYLDISADGFKLHTEISIDGGESWFLAVKQEYARGE